MKHSNWLLDSLRSMAVATVNLTGEYRVQSLPQSNKTRCSISIWFGINFD